MSELCIFTIPTREVVSTIYTLGTLRPKKMTFGTKCKPPKLRRTMTPEDEFEYYELEEFPGYAINCRGDIYNQTSQIVMRPSTNNYGSLKISLIDGIGLRRTVSVARLVAELFVPLDADDADALIFLDNNRMNVHHSNLRWRPLGFSLNYTRQFRVPIPSTWTTLPVTEYSEAGVFVRRHETIMDASMSQGYLASSIWHSVLGSCLEVYPTNNHFQLA